MLCKMLCHSEVEEWVVIPQRCAVPKDCKQPDCNRYKARRRRRRRGGGVLSRVGRKYPKGGLRHDTRWKKET